MKRAILYARVSTDRQAEQGFSREEQIVQLRNHCKRNDILVVKEYLEDYSAKDFQRPAFNEILSDIKSKKIIVDTLVVPKIDRFTRNLADTFGVVSELAKYNVTVFSIAEGELDFNNPHKFFPLIIQTGAAQYDNMLRSENTKRGMRQAMKNGRCVNTPPKGYINDKINKTIVVDKKNAELVQWSFNQYSKGIYSAEEVRREAHEKGLKLTKQSFLNMLKNPIYIGKILVPKTKDEPEELVNGLHEAIINEATFYNVQQILNGKRKPINQSKDDIANVLPLRGHLICSECGRRLTGGTPKGGSGKRYPHYHCQQTKYGCKHRFSAKMAHSVMEDYLTTFQPNEEVIKLFKTVLEDIFNLNDKERLNKANVLNDDAKQIDVQKERIRDDYLNGRITPEEYGEIKALLENKKNDLVMKHVAITKVPSNFDKYISYSCNLMKRLSYYYSNALSSTKSKIISLIFPEKLTFTGTWYKTTKTNEVFSLICSMEKGLKENCPAEFARQYSQAPPARLERATL